MWIGITIAVLMILLGASIEFMRVLRNKIDLQEPIDSNISLDAQTEFQALQTWYLKNLNREPSLSRYLKGYYGETIEYMKVQKKLEDKAKNLEQNRVVSSGSFETSKKSRI